jgi:hypothetical protein
MGALGASFFLLAVFSAIFIAPLVLGAYVVVGGGLPRRMSLYFGVITACFVVVLIIGFVATIAISLVR